MREARRRDQGRGSDLEAPALHRRQIGVGGVVDTQEALKRDVEYAQQRVRLRLLERQEQLMRVARDLSNQDLERRDFVTRTEDLISQYPELQAITWVDDKRRIRASQAAPTVASHQLRLPGEVLKNGEAAELFTFAQRMQDPVYSQPESNDGECTPMLQLHIPLSIRGQFGGVLLAVARIAGALDVEFGEGTIRLAGEEVDDAIRREEISLGASKVAALPAVRTALLFRQRAFRRAPGLVADGRDMGSVVFPDAGLKIFLTASAEARAERRYKQLIGKGMAASMDDLLRDLHERDARDSQRTVAPLKRSEDAVLLDTSGMTVQQAVDFVVDRAAALRN